MGLWCSTGYIWGLCAIVFLSKILHGCPHFLRLSLFLCLRSYFFIILPRCNSGFFYSFLKFTDKFVVKVSLVGRHFLVDRLRFDQVGTLFLWCLAYLICLIILKTLFGICFRHHLEVCSCQGCNRKVRSKFFVFVWIVTVLDCITYHYCMIFFNFNCYLWTI